MQWHRKSKIRKKSASWCFFVRAYCHATDYQWFVKEEKIIAKFSSFFGLQSAQKNAKLSTCFLSHMSDLPSQTSEDTPASLSWTAKHRIGEGSSEPVEFAVFSPISAVPVRANALTVSALFGAMGMAMVNLFAALVQGAEKKLAPFGIICRECR